MQSTSVIFLKNIYQLLINSLAMFKDKKYQLHSKGQTQAPSLKT